MGTGGGPPDGNYLNALIAFASWGYIVVAPFHGDLRYSGVRARLGRIRREALHTDHEFLRPIKVGHSVSRGKPYDCSPALSINGSSGKTNKALAPASAGVNQVFLRRWAADHFWRISETGSPICFFCSLIAFFSFGVCCGFFLSCFGG